MRVHKVSNGTPVALAGFLEQFKSSQGYRPPDGKPTLHQKALFVCWATLLFISLIRSLSRQLIGINFLNAGIQSSSSSTVTQGVIEDVEEASPQEAQHERRPLQRTQIDTITFDKFSHGVIILGLIMYYFYICDYVHFFPKASRTYSRDLFIVLMLLLFVVATSLAVKENGKRLLNRDQTEEWKGWMQVMFVWYHYFKAAEIYNAIRIFIAAYVWMTGFGNFSFFWVRKDYSIYRILKMLFRLNFLVTIVSLVTNNQYMLYYICAMHTFWFLSVYAMMRPYQHLNDNRRVMILKLSLYGSIVFIIYDLGFAQNIFAPFSFILDLNGSLHEWEFRSGLDHYATICGMICAYSHPVLERFVDFLESDSQTQREHFTKLGIRLGIGGMLLGIMILWYSYIYKLDKYEYNKIHPYTSVIPLLTYIYFRNVAPAVRNRHCLIFTWLGKITLETYIAQLHIYMQGNAKHLIVYISDYPLINFLFATIIYVFTSYSLFNVTNIVSGYLLPKNVKLLLKRVSIAALCIASSYIIAVIDSPYIMLEAVGYSKVTSRKV